MGIFKDIPITKNFYSPITLLSIRMEDKWLKKLFIVVQLEISRMNLILTIQTMAKPHFESLECKVY